MTPMRQPVLVVLVLFIALLLWSPPPPGRVSRLPSGAPQFSFVLPPKYFQYFTIDSFANSTVIRYTLSSNTTVSIAFMTLAQLQSFNSSKTGVSDSLFYQNGTTSQESLRAAPGSYALVAYSGGKTANVTLAYQVYPDNPFVDGPLASPQPTGIASFGLYNKSSIDSPYAVRSTDVIGMAEISALQAYNATAGTAQVNLSGATLQLNAMLVVNEKDGTSEVYWCQNTPDFVTAASQVAMADNVWKYSTSGLLNNSTVTSQGGLGYVSSFQQYGTTEYAYVYEGSNSTYSLPVGLVLLVNETAEPGTGVLVQYGDRYFGGGSSWFDNVTIHDPTVQSSYFLTSGNDTTPIGLPYDTELVFGGEGNGEATNFTRMSSTLGLFFTNGSSTSMSAFPSYFSFGGETEEAADNLRVSYSGDGLAQVSVGTPNYYYLGSASGSYSLAGVESAISASVSTTSSTSASSTSSSTASTSTSSALTAIRPSFIVAVVPVIAVVILALGIRRVSRRRAAKASFI